MPPSTISGINRLPDPEKRKIYAGLIPPQLMERFHLNSDFLCGAGADLLQLHCPPGSSSTEMALRHRSGFPDPILYGHITDTLTGQLHILLYILNDPDSPRFDVDILPDGRPTKFGTQYRNLPAEQASLEVGLAPGQVRRGLRLLGPAIEAFESFVRDLGHDLYFAEPLYYHNAVIFERYGFAYERGRRLMKRIQSGFMAEGDLLEKLDGSTPFRRPAAADSIRLRSWAVHDGVLGEPFTNVTMYKRVGRSADMDSCSGCPW